MKSRVPSILRSDADPSRHYVGITSHLRDRVDWHNHGPCGHTIHHRPWSIVVSMEFPSEWEAIRFEYAHDVSAGDKHTKARDLIDGLWDTMQGAVSTQVLQELTVNLRRKAAKPLDRRAAREIIEDYLAWHVVVNDGQAVLHALDLEERCQISFWDALIIHAAQLAGADTLYSEDLSNGQRYGTVRVVNPFVVSDAPQDEKDER